MARLFSPIILLLAGAAIAQAQTPFTSLLYTSGNITNDETNPTEFTACQTDSTLTSLGTEVSPDQLSSLQVDARWFGGSTVPASSFAVQDCSMFKLQNGRSVNVFSSSQKLTCQIYWEEAADFVTAIVNITSEDAYWTVSLPRVASAITRTTCYGTKTQCLLASSVPCNNLNLGTGAFVSYTATGAASSSSCPFSEPSEDYINDKDLLYGLKASFYPGAFQCPASDPNAQYSAPNLTTIAPDHRFDRCQDALDYTVPNTTFPSVPPLPDSLFSSCYAAKLEGYVRVDNNTDLQFLTPEPVPKFYNSYRVCLRFSNLVKLYLNDKLLIQSTTGDYDAVLTCLDVPDLPQGFLPFSVEFSTPPNAVDSVILQFYIIPVTQVVTDSRPGRDYQLTYKCDCCGLFSAAGSCCEPLDTCYFRTPDCGPLDSPPLPIFSSPPPASPSHKSHNKTPKESPKPPPKLESPPPAPKKEESPPPPIAPAPGPIPLPVSPPVIPPAIAPPLPVLSPPKEAPKPPKEAPKPPKEAPAPAPTPSKPSSPPLPVLPSPPPPKKETPAPSPIYKPPAVAPAPLPIKSSPPPLPVLPSPPPPAVVPAPAAITPVTPPKEAPAPAPKLSTPPPLPVLSSPPPPKETPSPKTPSIPAPGPSKASPPPPAPSSPSPVPYTPPGVSPTPGISPTPAPAPKSPPKYCPCDDTCVGKPAVPEVEDITFSTFQQLVSSVSSWDELEKILQS